MNLTEFLTLFAPAFFAGWACIYLFTSVARFSNFMPKNQIGGLAILSALSACLIFMLVRDQTIVYAEEFRALIFCFGLLGLVGVFDDKFDLPILPRLVIQIFVSLILAFLILDSDEFSIVFPNASYAVVLALTGMIVVGTIWTINAANFFDGIDWGLLGGVIPGIILFLMVHSPFELSQALYHVLVMIIGGLVIYGFYNKPPAAIYMGDGGSLPLGFLIAGCIFLDLLLNLSVAMSLAFSYFLFDTSATLLKRLFRGENIMKGHQTHAYQIARKNGYSVISISMIIFAISIINSGIGYISIESGWELSGQLLAVIVVFVLDGAVFLVFHTKGPGK